MVAEIWGGAFSMLLSRSLLCIFVSAAGCSNTRFTTRVVSFAELCSGTKATKVETTVSNCAPSETQGQAIPDVPLLDDDDNSQPIHHSETALKVKKVKKQEGKLSDESESSTSTIERADRAEQSERDDSLEDDNNEEYFSKKTRDGREYFVKYGDKEYSSRKIWLSGEQSSSESNDNGEQFPPDAQNIEEQSSSEASSQDTSGQETEATVVEQTDIARATHHYNLRPKTPKSSKIEKKKKSYIQRESEGGTTIGKAAKSAVKNEDRLCTTVPYNAMGRLANYVKSTRTETKVGAALIASGCVCYAAGFGDGIMDSEIVRAATGRVYDCIGSLTCSPNCTL